MKHLTRYSGFTPQDRQDEILDKISKYGIKSLTENELEFLNSFSKGKEKEVHDKISLKESEITFSDDDGFFTFEMKEVKNLGDELKIIGTLYVPDLTFEDGKRIPGRIEGDITYFPSTGHTELNFEVDVNDPYKKSKKLVKYDVFEFCEGLEYELDSFIDYVVSEIENNI